MAQRRSLWPALVLLALLLVAAAAGLWWYLQTQVPTSLALTATSFSNIDGWNDNDPRPALAAFRRSCAVLASEPAGQTMGGSGYAGTTGDWQSVCSHVPDAVSARDARRWFEENFSPLEASSGIGRSGLFTGYYEPELRGSREAHAAFRTPVYGMPSDLIEVDLGQFRDALHGERIAGRLDGRRLVPYPTRAMIDADGLPTAPVLFYGDDPVAVFFLQIQGSGRVRYADGTVRRVAYAGQNGQVYTPVGRALADEGALPREHMSMQAIRSWMKANPGEARRIMEKDASFVFFKETALGDASMGSPGSEGVPLTPNASLAVDQRLHALGVPIFVSASGPASDPAKPEEPLRSLFVAQDTGGAIRGPVRGDVFFGFGADAESRAGRMKSNGRLYVLLPKALAARAAGAAL